MDFVNQIFFMQAGLKHDDLGFRVLARWGKRVQYRAEESFFRLESLLRRRSRFFVVHIVHNNQVWPVIVYIDPTCLASDTHGNDRNGETESCMFYLQLFVRPF